MNKYVLTLITTSFIVLYSCNKETITDTSDNTGGNSSSDTIKGIVDENGYLTSHELASDYVWNTATIVNIKLNETSISVDKTTGTTISGSNITITSPGTYKVTGSLTNGQIRVKTDVDSVVRIILSGVTIKNSTTSPLYIKKAGKVVIILPDNTTSTISDATSYVFETSGDTEPDAAIFSHTNLTIYGNGTLNVTGNYNDAIASKDGLVIRNALIKTTSVDDGIRGKDYLILNNANITVSAKGDGLKSENDMATSVGYILINDGTYHITSGSDGITAYTNVHILKGTFNIISGGGSSVAQSSLLSTKGIKGLTSVTIDDGTFVINTSDDGIHSNNSVVINKGTFGISSSDDGIHSDNTLTINNGDITISKSYEGIEAVYITVENGNISVTSSNDGFNSSKGLVAGGTESNDNSSTTINGGTIYVSVTNGDGLDSNGNLYINGGTIIVNGPASNPEVAIDYNGTCKITGGLLIATGPGSNMTQGPSTSSTQNSLKLIMTKTVAANTLFHIQDSDGKDLVTIKSPRSFTSVVFSSPDLKSGSSYSIYTGGSSTGTAINNFYSGGTYSGGTLYSTFTVSGTVTSVGSSSGGGGFGG